MAGSSRTGPWITIILESSDRSWSCGLFLSKHGDNKDTHYHPDVNALDAPQVEKQDGYDLFDNKSPLSINIFCHISQMYNFRAWIMFVFVFLKWMFSKFFVLSSKITFDCDIFFPCGFFGCHCIAFLFCMIIAVSKQLLCSIKFCWRRWCWIKKLFIIHD